MATAVDFTLRQVDYWAYAYRRTWKGNVVSSFLLPVLYLLAMGVGLGTYVDNGSGSSSLGGVSYLEFIAPGVLAATALQVGVAESTYPIMGGFKWYKTYYGMIASPLRPADVMYAQLGFIAFRIASTCAVFVLVMAIFGTFVTPWGLLSLLVAILVGMAAAAPVAAIAVRLENDAGFALVFRFGVLPMTLFSGAFFPVSQLPDVVEWLAYVTPLWHGVELARALSFGSVSFWPAVGHVAYLSAWFIVGTWLAVTGLTRRLIK